MFIIFVVSLLLFKDIYNPYYSLIGDEYPFFDKAKDIAQESLTGINIASQNGVYGYHPILDSVFQGIVMKIFGVSLIGWKLSNIIVVDFSIILIFILGMLLFNSELVGFVAGAFFGFSHYIFAFAHIGYNNLNALIPFLLSVIFLVRYIKYANNIDVLLSGIFSGLSFYTFFSARFIMLLAIPVVLSSKKLKGVFWYILGFSVLFIPFLITNGVSIYSQMAGQTFNFPYENNGTGFDKLSYFLLGLVLEKYIAPHHFMIGPLINPILFISLLLGILVVLRTLRLNIKLLLLAQFLFIATLIVVSFYKLEVPITRLHIIMPSICLIAAYGIVKLIKKKVLVLIILVIYVSVELTTFYIGVSKVQFLNHNSLILQLANENKNKMICVLDDNPNTFILRLRDLYKLHNLSVHSVSSQSVLKGRCDIITGLPGVDIKNVLDVLSPIISNREQVVPLKPGYYEKRYSDPANINSIIYYEYEN